ncbi:sulfurtransferase [Micromonospora sp. SL4-19]|uniref:sulfurtransferase n=1 Tax=Micromonospora sp. SL4-19 TaxID=3399129 RepID=UPI003A4D4499
MASHLVSCGDLFEWMTRQSVRIIDMRWPVGAGSEGLRQHHQARIPGAVYLGFDAVQMADPAPVGRAIPPTALAETLLGLGVDDTTTVIAYDDNYQFTAARLVWLMRAYGFERVVRLDGGWPAWLRAGLPVEKGPPSNTRPTEGSLHLTHAVPAIARLHDVRAHVAAGLPIVDCRRASSWEEDPRLIPGASRLPMRMLLDSEGLGLPRSAILAEAAAAGIRPGVPAIAYCGAAISAAAVWLSLASAGISDVRVYDGSLTEWISTGQPLHTRDAP